MNYKLLKGFLDYFPKGNICELLAAYQKILEGRIEKYHCLYELYFVLINLSQVYIEYDDGADEIHEVYSLEVFSGELNRYIAEYKEKYGVDLSIPDENYEPLTEGIIEGTAKMK